MRIVERQGVPRVSPRRALLRDRRRQRQGARRFLSGCLRARRRSVPARGWTIASAARTSAPSTPCRWPTWSAISCPPAPGKPALLTHDDVVTMFHEFGHGLHHMLTRVGYPSIAGINGVSWDAVELPSQFLENFAWRPEVLATMARHYETGAPLPAEQAGASCWARAPFMRASRRCGSSSSRCSISACTPNTTRRVARASTRSSREVRAEVGRVRGAGVEPLPAQLRRISSRADMPRVTTATSGPKCSRPMPSPRSRKHGVFDRAVAQRFLDAILSAGGSRKALDAFVEFRGRPPT